MIEFDANMVLAIFIMFAMGFGRPLLFHWCVDHLVIPGYGEVTKNPYQ